MVNGKKLSDSGAGDTSGSRRSTRSQNNPSSSLRKSSRLVGRSPPATPSPMKKKSENPSPLRRSPGSKGSKRQSKGGSSTPDSSKEKQDQTLKEIAKEVKQNSVSEVVSKRTKRLDARRYRDMFKPLKKIKTSESESEKKKRSKSSDISGGQSDSEKDEEGQHQLSDSEDSGEDCADTIHGGDGDPDSVSKSARADKLSEFEDGDNNLKMEISGKAEAVLANGLVVEKLPNGKMLSGLDKLFHGNDGLGCSQKGVISGAFTIEKEGSGTNPMDLGSVATSCKTYILSEECAKCFRKRSLDYDSQEQELCCCLSNIVNDKEASKDRGQGRTCTAKSSEEHGQKVKQSHSSLDVQGKICGTCQRAGKLLQCCGKGCGRSYHPSCSLNPENYLYLPNWYCFECTKKRFSFGVHSVSQGIESILDVKEVELSTEGRPKQKRYYVKYKGLAHIHNRWIPEIRVVQEVPELHAKFGKLKEDTHWNPIWIVPHRLLQRRSVIINDYDGKPIGQEASLESVSQQEWLVKWCGLDYDQATWESENSTCLKKPEAQLLIKEYETRHSKVQNEIQEKRKGSHIKLGRHSVGGADNYYQNFVNKLRECHHRGHNAILLDEQDRFVKVTYLVSCLVASVCRPFLIIVPHGSLFSWEAEFTRLTPSINVVVYDGNKDARDIVRSVEFFEGDHVMLQVLISSPEVITEDADKLKGIEWEAVIIDDCQQSCILAHSGSIMKLATGWRLLLVNSQLEDNISEYINVLSLLEPDCSLSQHPEPVANSNEAINMLKDKMSPFIVCARFLEYWVPVEMSNLQLEQYCYSILSKSSVLRSISKSDPVGSLREILILLRKCCDHPYIVDMQLQHSLADGLPYDAVMDLGIKASGKLHLLEKLLSELKNKELKVLILFQPAGGSGRDSTGNILDDFLRFRFGSDSYEHVESGLVSSKKQTACNRFNGLKERSFLLLETRACGPSIKLALIDAVIIFDSDWNPLNDLRALQKITVDSKLDQIKVFRLYCPGTVEERVLILVKNDVILDSTLQSISPSINHMLLMWGSSDMLSRLDKFHHDNISDCKDNIVFGSSLSIDVTQEIVSLFQSRKICNSMKYISVAQQNGGCYLKSIPLIGEQRFLQDEGVAPHVFWTHLLEGLKPQWKYLSGSSQRNRKRVQYYDESPEVQNDEATKRRKKTDSTKIDSSSMQVEPRLETPIINSQSKANTDPNSQKGNGSVIAEFDNLKNLHSEQRGLFEILKPTILQLCEALLLKDDGKKLVEQFLEYLVKNYRVTKEPESRLQAFLLSVCWTAVEGLKKKIDHKTSVTIVREKLGFGCTINEAEDIYSKLKPIFSSSGIMNQHLTSDLSSWKAEKSFEKYIKKVEKGCDKKMERLKVKHDEELKKFEKSSEDERMKLESWCKLESAVIRVAHANSSVGTDKLRALDNNYAKKREDLEKKIVMSLKELEAKQQIEREEEQKEIAGFMERVKSLGHTSHAKNGVTSQVANPIERGNESIEPVCKYGNLLEQQNSEREASRTSGAAMGLIASENLENTDNLRANCKIDDSINVSENIAVSKGSGILTCPPEQPCASTGQPNIDINPVIDVVNESSISLPSNQISEARPMGSSTKHRTTDTIQVLGAESHIGVEEQVSGATCINNSSSLDESSPLSSLPHTGDMSHSTECSLNEWVNNYNVTPNSRIQPNENDASIGGGTTIPMHQDHTSSGPSGMTVSQRLPQLAIDQSVDTNYVPIGVVSSHASLQTQVHTPITSVSRVPTSLPDPLQIELERLRNEMAKVMNHHEGTKVQLKTECDKEIEELIAQVTKKYEKKLDEAEASFSQKKNELEMSQHKVMMNKILAEAFRSKCTDYKATPKIQQLGILSSSVESSSRSHHTRPVSATGPLSTTLATGSVSTAPPVQGVGPVDSCSRSHHTRPVPATVPLSTIPATGLLSTALPVQGVGPATPLPTQSRMVRINPGGGILTGQQQQVRREAHAPALPIQAFRSSTPISSSNVPIVPLRNNTMSSSALHLPPQAPQSAPSLQLNPHGRPQQEALMGWGTPFSHLSNTELIMDITRRNDANHGLCSGNVPPFSENMPSSQSSSSLPAGNVVCLSDDE